MASDRRNYSQDDNNGSSNLAPFLWGVLAGGLVGAAFALLYAPKTGSETRRDLRFRFDDMTDSVNDLIKRTMGEEEEYANDSRDRAARVVDNAKAKASDLMNDADRSIREARRRAQSTTTQGSNTDNDVPPEATNDEL